MLKPILNFLFSRKITATHYQYRIFGIKIAFRSKKLMANSIRSLDERLQSVADLAKIATRWNLFFWENEDKFTAREYEWYVCQQFYEGTGYYPNLKNPRSFNEKLSWLKLHYEHPDAKRLQDKYEFKKYIAEVLGDGWTVPLLGVWDDAADIDFDSLPNKFVLKITTGGGGNYGIYVVRNKAELDRDRVRYMFNEWLQRWNIVGYFTLLPGRKATPRIIAEKYMEDASGQLRDYKFLCFHGEPKLMWIDSDRYNGHRRNLYDMEKNLLDVLFRFPHCIEDPDSLLPRQFDRMVELARKLSAPFPHMRVDFYEVDDKIYVGELTSYTAGACGNFIPREYDFELGECLDLNKVEKAHLEDGLIPLQGEGAVGASPDAR